MSIEIALVNALGEPHRGNNGDLVFICPFCFSRKGDTSSKPKLHVNIDKGLVHCFRCEYKAHFLLPFLVDVFGPSFDRSLLAGLSRATIREGKKISEVVLEALKSFKPKDIFSTTKFHSIDLPDGYIPLDESDTWFANRAKAYLKGRGLTDAQIRRHYIGYTMEGRYRHMLIFPTFKNNFPVYFVTRGVGNDDRKINPSLAECEFGKAHWVYNYDSIKHYNEIVLVEGVMDCLTTGENCGCLFGKQISDQQFATLMDLPAEKFTIMMDDDAKKYTLEIADRFRGLREVNVVLLEKGDPNVNRSQIATILHDQKKRPALADKVRAILQ